MGTKSWETLKVQYCVRSGMKVQFEAEVVHPAEWLPDQPPRIVAHRCSHGSICMATGQGMCRWSGANPDYDPFMKN